MRIGRNDHVLYCGTERFDVAVIGIDTGTIGNLSLEFADDGRLGKDKNMICNTSQTFALVSYGSNFHVFNFVTFESLLSAPSDGQVFAACFDVDRVFLATQTGIEVWDYLSSKLRLYNVLFERKTWFYNVRCMRFVPTLDRLVIVGDRDIVRHYDTG